MNATHYPKYGDPSCWEKKLDDLWEESKEVGLEINPLKTEEIRLNTIINQVLRLNGEDIKRSSDFCSLVSVVVRPGHDADPSAPSSAVVKKEQSCISTLPMGNELRG